MRHFDEKMKRQRLYGFPSLLLSYLRDFHFHTLGMAVLLEEALLPPAEDGEEGGGQAWREGGREGRSEGGVVSAFIKYAGI